jgi:hypothetical protein
MTNESYFPEATSGAFAGTATNMNQYPKEVEKAQPWMAWMKFIPADKGGSIVTIRCGYAESANLGGH